MGNALAKVVDDVASDLEPQTLGVIFKNARVGQKKNLEVIAEQLKIRKVFLEAIENEQFEQLPGGVYTVGFIRSYAKYLNLDHDAIINQLKDEKFFKPINLPTVGDVEHFPTTRFVPRGMVIVGLFLLAFCAIATYVFFEDLPVQINWPKLKPSL